MARITVIPHVTARIRVAGELAIEFLPPCDKYPPTNTDKIPFNHCYIESKSGDEFCIEVTVAPGFEFPRSHDRFILQVYIDGNYIDGQAFPKHIVENVSYTVTTPLAYDHSHGKKTTAGKLIFTPVTTTSDLTTTDMPKNDFDRLEDLGTIRIELSTGRFKKLTSLKSRAATAQSHAPNGDPMRFSSIGNVRPFAEFFFHYRSYEALQHEMVIPRTPSPEQPTAKALTEDILSKLSEEEICYLSEKLCELQAKQDSQRIKREANSPPRGQKSSKLKYLVVIKQENDQHIYVTTSISLCGGWIRGGNHLQGERGQIDRQIKLGKLYRKKHGFYLRFWAISPYIVVLVYKLCIYPAGEMGYLKFPGKGKSAA
ncbi:hypothetical protein FOXB_00551 [Fusarium oxysporum f. sp. conglutinans Fo5176]|uniref:DUF7918 domain-containing protein n=1 Tax=Fusarium oxysporum (strain Fo5176) TaxID=660025 RepID=F9F2C7_FUSOF|nr:hypothetical protein FOXB_00551 [Fusarium oxysporum f. sp. conglutinans Fo5176]